MKVWPGKASERVVEPVLPTPARRITSECFGKPQMRLINSTASAANSASEAHNLISGRRALIMTPERANLIGRSGLLLHTDGDHWLMVVDGNRYRVLGRSLMQLPDDFTPPPKAAAMWRIAKCA